MTARSAVTGCLYCIDGFAPDGIHPVLGPVFITCGDCLISGAVAVCRSCFGEAWFPADFRCLKHLLAHLNAYGMSPVLCPACEGVTAVLEETL
jgi:hypothetical protein